ncbi:hypothetical protein [Cohnella soli]|uniref:Prepilin type IV endopeptidase peptidase domain-containing protein n=1 Tax=Cohnella soli TaxID=425005 RepID=A0ABW0HNW3_9BACL
MTLLFLIAISICGLYDYKTREVPLWSMILVAISGIGMCVAHPVFSLLSGTVVLIFCLFNRMGTADRILYPLAAAALGMLGVMYAGIALAIAAWHVQRTHMPAPAVTYLAIVCTLVLTIGGLL